MKQNLLLALLVNLAFALASLPATANVDVLAPVSQTGLVGTWEALPTQEPFVLFHMEINASGDSYLVETSVGVHVYVVRRLLSSEVKDGNVRLYFGEAIAKEGPNMPSIHNDAFLNDIWIVGSGFADPVIRSQGVNKGELRPFGVIEATVDRTDPAPHSGLPAPKGVYKIKLIKSPWTRDVAEASRIAEALIKERPR